MARKKKSFSFILSSLVNSLLSIANFIGTFFIQAVLWIAEVVWWLIKGLLLLVVSIPSLFKKNKTNRVVFKKTKTTLKATNPIFKPFTDKDLRRKLLPGLVVTLLFLVGFVVYSSRQATEAEAAWWDETWLYRRAIDLENPSSTVENAQIKVFDGQDLSTLVSEGKLQESLADLRFTDRSGNLLQYYIEDDTNSAVEAWILIPSLIEGESVIYMYYGNASANSASNSVWMADLGGEISYFEGYRIHAFLENGSYANYHKRNIEYMIVAGGGGGGSRHGGGGGAGGVVHNLESTPLLVSPQSYNILVGDGGLGASAGTSSDDSTNGEDSIAFGLTAVGGGKGTSTSSPGSGGSGGGSRGNNTYTSGGDGIPGQGNRGGRGNNGGSMMGGGGGGYSEPGKDADVPNEGDGGAGFDASTFFGTSYGESGWFAGGGGGGNTGSRGLGGQGGGGNGGGLDGDDGLPGMPNTGGGGGAGGHHGTNRPGKNGGSGIVLVRYQSNVNTPTDIIISSPSGDEEITPGPVAYWKFDEGTGTTAHDSSGQGNHGTITGATWQTKDQCIAGKCLLFNGNDEIEISENKIFDITEAISINLWVKPINITGRIAVLNHSSFSSESNGYSFEIHDGKLVLVINGGRTVGSTQKCNESIPINKFSQVSWTRDSNGTNKLYVNGKECTYESTITNEQSSVNTTLGIGSRLGKQNLPPFTDYSNKNYSSPYSAGCWGGDAATITYYPDEGYNNLSYKKLTKTAGGTGGCYITEHSSFPIENSKSYIVSAWMRANQTVTLNGYALDLNRGSDNAYRTGVTPVLNTSWQRISWIYDSGLDHAGDYQSRQIIYVNENLPLDVYWSDFQVEDITGTNYSTPSQNFYGYLDEVKIYSYARTEEQIKADYAAGSGAKGGTAIFGHKPETPQVTPISEKLVAHWRFDEGYGTTAHNSIGPILNGTLTGTTLPTWAEDGLLGKALYFSSGYVQTDTITLDTSFSFSVWFNPSSFVNWAAVLTNLHHSAPASGLNIIPRSGDIRICYGDGVNSYSNYIVSLPEIVTNEWNHAVITYNGTTASLYLNGYLRDSRDISIAQSNNSIRMGIWASSYSDYLYNGLIDEVKVYNTALTPEEILQDYNQGATAVMGALGTDDTGQPSHAASAEYCIPGDDSHCAPPVARWDFEEGSGTTAHDRSGNNNHGALVNNPSWVTGKVGKALEFDGGTTYINFTGNAFTPKTVSLWFKTNSHETMSLISPRSGGGSPTNWGAHLINGKVYFYSNYESEYKYIDSEDFLNDGEWHNIVGISQNETTYLYINGIKQVGDSGTEMGLGHAIGYIGAHYKTGDPDITKYFNGLIDQVRIYDYARTPAQIAWDYNRGAPVGHWKFDECQGATAHDSSSNESHGTINIGASGSQTSVGTCTSGNSAHAWYNGREGRMNSAMSFDGTDDYVDLGVETFDYINNRNPISVFAWVNTTNREQSFAGIFSKSQGGSTTTVRFDLHYYFQGEVLHLRQSIGDGSSTTRLSRNINWVNNNEWHLIGMTWDGENMKLFLDGRQLGDSATINLDIGISTASWKIGRAFNSSSYSFPGLIDDVRIYNYALTDEQVKLLHNEGAAVRFGN